MTAEPPNCERATAINAASSLPLPSPSSTQSQGGGPSRKGVSGPSFGSNNGTRWIVFLIAVWYITSSCAVVLTKALFSGLRLGHSTAASTTSLAPFPFGLTVTATNNIVAWLVTGLILRAKEAGISGSGPASSVPLRRRLAAVIGIATAGEIGLSNVALSLLSLSYATVLKGVAPLFVMSWGVALGLVRVRLGLVAAMALLAGGMALTVGGELDWGVVARMYRGKGSDYGTGSGTEDEGGQSALVVGLAVQTLSGVLSGLRWVITQMFIKGQQQDTVHERGENIHSVNTAQCPCCTGVSSGLRSYLGSSSSSKAGQPRPSTSAIQVIRSTAPLTVAALAPAIAIAEARGIAQWVASAEHVVWEACVLAATLGTIGVMVAGLLWAEYELVGATSSLSVSVGFVVKEALVIAAGRAVFGDALTATTWGGFALVQAGVVWYALETRRNGDKESARGG